MKKYTGIFIIPILTLLFAGCADKPEEYADIRGTDYAGSESCIQCHQTVSHHYQQTAHYKATAPASLKNVFGNFTSGHNVFEYDPNTKLVMEKRKDSVYQVLYKNGKEVKAYRFDIVFGIRHAQTAVYWHNNNTFELPISYYKSVNDWGTSPGFSATDPYFERMAIKDCYACHSSNVTNKPVTESSEKTNFMTMEVEDVMNKETVIYGIDCERCHGPAKLHVDYHLKYPNIKTAHGITGFNVLSNQQKVDACAICHSGSMGLKIKSRFQFRPGDNLTDFYRVPLSGDYDVHGNQAGLMMQSKCFIQSKTLNCINCHNPHENASKSMAFYSNICLSCHATVPHSPVTTKNIAEKAMKGNCIDCHMPTKSSGDIKFKLSKNIQGPGYNLRTHKIAVYPVDK